MNNVVKAGTRGVQDRFILEREHQGQIPQSRKSLQVRGPAVCGVLP